ncbi:hypothetical protein PoB_007406400 [Plakobranchus ocellatus]|uniref:Uncharacterized protein n=1 Tax=Plakobranchus ocellatus TaxID=259542 RepID=A0AAV4DTK3_9GAST|nr:hypothetical protein PoB_007406400 [Plakobranchus ocellatus]
MPLQPRCAAATSLHKKTPTATKQSLCGGQQLRGNDQSSSIIANILPRTQAVNMGPPVPAFRHSEQGQQPLGRGTVQGFLPAQIERKRQWWCSD